MKLQTETDAVTGQRVLTCYLLPQQAQAVPGSQFCSKKYFALMSVILFVFWSSHGIVVKVMNSHLEKLGLMAAEM